ncbi:hypothetical protein QUF61_03625 [Candidatus Venteria ishoeyi]|uniref:hypothetical protein n=1 Tax=Candidatus Venteria ishoeyi TaxID=1899563 RepID=UPI0025A64D14|nr:hypothetical protein [Candidatus Venteria ishoeyi]MDM8545564.1 hypothetical protein [Candidatus Venteria ishoeyi]
MMTILKKLLNLKIWRRLLLGISAAYFLAALFLLLYPNMYEENRILLGYIAPNHFGELVALIGLLSVVIPILLDNTSNLCEPITAKRIFNMALLLLILGIAYAVRTPVPPAGSVTDGLAYIYLDERIQLAVACGMGLLTIGLTHYAMKQDMPRVSIVLLMNYLLYFSSGHLFFNPKSLEIPALFVAMLAFDLLVMMMAMKALIGLTPVQDKELADVIALEGLREKLKKQENKLKESFIAQQIQGISRRPAGKEKPKEVNVVNIEDAKSEMALPPMMLGGGGGGGIPSKEMEETIAEFRAFKEEITMLREEYKAAEAKKLEETENALQRLSEKMDQILY